MINTELNQLDGSGCECARRQIVDLLAT